MSVENGTFKKNLDMKHFVGLMAAPFTPFDSDGNVNRAIIPDYVDKLVSDGLKGIFVCGSNGEGPNMTVEERMLTAQAFTEAVASRLKVFVHVGHSSIKESRKLASHAASIGAGEIVGIENESNKHIPRFSVDRIVHKIGDRLFRIESRNLARELGGVHGLEHEALHARLRQAAELDRGRRGVDAEDHGAGHGEAPPGHRLPGPAGVPGVGRGRGSQPVGPRRFIFTVSLS